jgi:hypothetical protein
VHRRCCFRGRTCSCFHSLIKEGRSRQSCVHCLGILHRGYNSLFPHRSACLRVNIPFNGCSLQSSDPQFSFSIWKLGTCVRQRGAAHQLITMPTPPDGSQPSMVSEEDYNKLEDELLAVFSKGRIGSGAYGGSNHITNPSTSSLPDPQSYRMYRFQLLYALLSFFFQMRVVRFPVHYQQRPTENLPVSDLFLQLPALQTLRIRRAALLSAQLATIRWYFQFFQRPHFTDVNLL